MCEAGHQKGAREAAYLTNIQLTSLADLSETCAQELAMMQVRKLYLRGLRLGDRYWELDKDTRIKHGLRGEVGTGHAYSGNRVIKAAKAALLAAMFHGFPVVYNELYADLLAYGGGAGDNHFDGAISFESPIELVDFVSDRLAELDSLLQKAERGQGEHR